MDDALSMQIRQSLAQVGVDCGNRRQEPLAQKLLFRAVGREDLERARQTKGGMFGGIDRPMPPCPNRRPTR